MSKTGIRINPDAVRLMKQEYGIMIQAVRRMKYFWKPCVRSKTTSFS